MIRLRSLGSLMIGEIFARSLLFCIDLYCALQFMRVWRIGRAALLGAFLGCNAISGIEDYSAGPTADTARDATPESRQDAAGDLHVEDALEADVEADVDELGPKDTAETGETAPDTFDASTEASTDADAAETAADTCAHSNGLGQTYFRCVPLGVPGKETTYSLDMARAARDAWPMAGTDGEGNCATAGTPAYVWRKTSTSCAGWAYTNGGTGAAGHVYLGSTACSCPNSTTPTWE